MVAAIALSRGRKEVLSLPPSAKESFTVGEHETVISSGGWVGLAGD